MTDESVNNRHFEMQRIYLKDASFEVPNTPQIFLQDWKPQIDIQIGTEANRLEEGVYEVTLKVTVTNKVGEKTAFLVEVEQGGVFIIRGFPEQEMTPMLGSYCPNLLFPYVREAVSDLVTKGSFPQFLLAPVNFDALLAQKMQHAQQQEEEKQEGGEEASPEQTH